MIGCRPRTIISNKKIMKGSQSGERLKIMNKIICPECGATINVSEADYAAILQQVQNDELKSQVNSRVSEITRHLEEKHGLETSNAVNAALMNAEKKHQDEMQTLKQQLEQKVIQIQQANGTIQKLNSEAQASAQARDLAVLQATTELRKQMDSQRVSYEEKLATERAQANAEKAKLQYSLEQQKEQTEFYRDLKTKMSTKMVGETLEQHCEISFNQIRMSAYPNAEFGKDNDASSGTKGDYIFREKDPGSGTEIVSIMFEMKNETDSTSTKHKNEDFFEKLDKDRREKGCEYAVLVTMLEPENEYYNAGIVDVSYKYPKMYVVRPQNFTAVIGLIRNAVMGVLQYKQELALAKAQHVDLTEFEDRLLDFKNAFGSNVEQAGKKFDEAIEGIDKTIAQLQKIKTALTTSNKHLIAANNKVDNVTVKKLTKELPTVQALLEEAKAAKQGVREAS